MKVDRLVVGKGKTTRIGDAEEWIKIYFAVEMIVEEPGALEVAKANLTGLIDGWLSSTPTTAKPVAKPPAQLPEVKEEKHSCNWDPQKIPWLKAEGSRGAYERYPAQDKRPEATPDYKNLLQALKEHSKSFLFRDGFNYWLFQDAVTVGRKHKA
jgi:hypothetical protein